MKPTQQISKLVLDVYIWIYVYVGLQRAIKAAIQSFKNTSSFSQKNLSVYEYVFCFYFSYIYSIFLQNYLKGKEKLYIYHYASKLFFFFNFFFSLLAQARSWFLPKLLPRTFILGDPSLSSNPQRYQVFLHIVKSTIPGSYNFSSASSLLHIFTIFSTFIQFIWLSYLSRITARLPIKTSNFLCVYSSYTIIAKYLLQYFYFQSTLSCSLIVTTDVGNSRVPS